MLSLNATLCYAENYYPITVTKVTDADTIDCDIHLPWNIVLVKQKVRLTHYDAWETSRRRQSVTVTDDEIRKGVIAKDECLRLVRTAKTVFLTSGGEAGGGNYGRILGGLFLDIEGEEYDPYRTAEGLLDYAKYMKANGHQRE